MSNELTLRSLLKAEMTNFILNVCKAAAIDGDYITVQPRTSLKGDVFYSRYYSGGCYKLAFKYRMYNDGIEIYGGYSNILPIARFIRVEDPNWEEIAKNLFQHIFAKMWTERDLKFLESSKPNFKFYGKGREQVMLRPKWNYCD